MEPLDKIAINPNLISSGWSDSANQIVVTPGRVTIEVSLYNQDKTGYVSPGEILLGTIEFRANRPFTNKTISFDTDLTEIVTKATATNILKMQNSINYSSPTSTNWFYLANDFQVIVMGTSMNENKPPPTDVAFIWSSCTPWSSAMPLSERHLCHSIT